MKCERVWIVERPIKGGKWKRLAAAFSEGAARTSMVPGLKDRIVEGVIVTDVPENFSDILLSAFDIDRVCQPVRKAKKAAKRKACR